MKPLGHIYALASVAVGEQLDVFSVLEAMGS